jgi:hypothetical protein
MATLSVVTLLAILGAPTAAPNASPAEVVRAFYRLASQSKCKDAERLFTAESVAVIRRALKPEDGFAIFCAGKRGRSSLSTLVVTKEASDGDRATVETMRTYEQGDVAIESDELVRQGGTWRIVVGESKNPVGNKQ